MFGRKKAPEPAREPGKRKGAELMNQLGFGGMPGVGDIDAMVYGDSDDDADLEAELAELAGEDYEPAKKAKPKRKAHVPLEDIEKMAAAGMQDIDEDVSDTEDPDLLAELQDLADEDEDEINEAPSPAKSQHVSPQKTPTALSPQQPAPSNNFPIFEPTLPSPSPTNPPRNLPSPQKAPSPAPRASPAPSPRPSPVPSPKPSTGAGGGMVGLLEERMNMYKQAFATAKSAGDSSKQRRMDRGIKTLTGLLRQAKAGKPVNEEEIPPPVAMGGSVAVAPPSEATSPTEPGPSSAPAAAPAVAPKPSPAPVPAQPSGGYTGEPSTSTLAQGQMTGLSSSSGSNASKSALEMRRDQYKKAALMAKHGGDMAKAGSYVRIAKQFDAVIQALEEGKPVDLSKMPPVPPEFAAGESVKSVSKPQPSVSVERTTHQAAGDDEPELPTVTAEEEKSMFKAPDAPKTVMEALTQRLEKYKTTENDAKTAGEGSKARRMGRIVKQYQDAIKAYKAGKPVDFDELPTPPGFAPIPVNTSASASSAPAPAPRPSPAAAPAPQAAAAAAPARPAPTAPGQRPPAQQPPAAAAKPIQRQNTGRKSMHSRQEQQLAFLKERLGEFKQAAMNAKKNHDIELAKKYIRMMKGMEPMIDACETGLPVDLSQVPPSPAGCDDAEDKFVVVSAEDCKPTGDREEVFKTLNEDLVRQIRVCVTNAQHYQKLGDVPAAAKFQKLEQNSRKDLESLKSAFRHGDPAPRFHYETRSFSMVQSNTDLGDGDMELTIIRGIQYNLPSGYAEKDMDTQVKYEFGFPTEEPQTGSTGTVKDTINPEYNQSFKIQINRKSKGLFRFIERKGLKLEVIMKRGFFKGDKVLGTATVKLLPLDSQCSLHDSFDLMDGRKSVGGKLEVKIRIRDPFKSKQVDEVKEKWLVIDQFIRTVGSKSQAEAKAPKQTRQVAKKTLPSSSANAAAAAFPEGDGTTCMEVLRFEKQQLDKQIGQLKDSLSVTQTQTLRHKSALIQEKLELQQKKLREGGIEAWKAYLAAVQKETYAFDHEARQHVKLGEVQKAELMMTKKKLAEKEMNAIKEKIPNA